MISRLDSVLGIATFNLEGLPQCYFATEDNPNLMWIQTAFQTLGLRSLLSLGDFDHAIVYGQNHCILLVQQPQTYVAVLLPATVKVSSDWIEWAQKFEINELSDRFQAS
ncbi:hypothetical protein ACKFKG_23790 [Phormidesmis sp. 146-35]